MEILKLEHSLLGMTTNRVLVGYHNTCLHVRPYFG